MPRIADCQLYRIEQVFTRVYVVHEDQFSYSSIIYNFLKDRHYYLYMLFDSDRFSIT
jgi:hypothetical protein